MIGNLIFFSVMLVLGLIILTISRRLAPYTEEQRKEELGFREMSYGPPGYYRAVGTVFGVILIVVGVSGVFGLLVFP